MCITDARFQLGFVVEMLVLSLLSMSGAVLEYFSFLTKTSIIFKKKKKFLFMETELWFGISFILFTSFSDFTCKRCIFIVFLSTHNRHLIPLQFLPKSHKLLPPSYVVIKRTKISWSTSWRSISLIFRILSVEKVTKVTHSRRNVSIKSTRRRRSQVVKTLDQPHQNNAFAYSNEHTNKCELLCLNELWLLLIVYILKNC